MSEFNLEKEIYEIEELTDNPALAKIPDYKLKILEDISKWQLEAKYESEERYFYKTGFLTPLYKGEKYFVIGRKGTGKTAICQHFLNLSKKHTNVRSKKLSFKNFPYNELYESKDVSYPIQSQYITLWKFLIFNTLLEQYAAGVDDKNELRSRLRKVYKDYDAPFDRKVRYWLGDEFSVNFLGNGFTTKRSNDNKPKNWMKIVDDLEDLTFSLIDENIYYVLFDELDEDYKNILQDDQKEKYTNLLISLFKAVQDVFDRIGREKKKIFPIVFLRDDIYDLIKDVDKTKSRNFKIEIGWNEDSIQQLLLHRINSSISDENLRYKTFDRMWSDVISSAYIQRPGGKKVASFYYISRSTHNRPRDYIAYLSECSKSALKRHGVISSSIIKDCDKSFSNYFKDELTDELFSIYPEITEIFDCISQQRKWIFKQSEFERIFQQKKKNHLIPDERSLDQVLQVLFYYSIIGNEINVGQYSFKYQKPSATFNYRENLVVHRGLFKSLQII